MEKHNMVGLSKFLSLILRHQPDKIGLQLDANGWAAIDELITKSAAHHNPFSRATLLELVAANGKQRFALNDAQTHIRANQGHSVQVDLALQTQVPPAKLYHGTVARFLDSIRQEGLLKMSRQHVHLSATLDTAQKVGSRRGQPHILIVNSGQMHQDGYALYLSDNGVWLTDQVPARYIDFEGRG